MKELLNIFLGSTGVSTDTRTLLPGQIFFAIKGDNFDGNQFARKALEMEAAYAVVSDPAIGKDDRFIQVDNVLHSLQRLATRYREMFPIPVIAITGTNGKTTTKELFASVFSRQFSVLATEGNFNNHLGVPLTLLKLKPHHQLAIVEMGASGKNEISLLCRIARPTMGIITNVGSAHLEGFGSVQGVIEAKSEMFEYLNESGGTVFFPESLHDIEYIKALHRQDWEKYTSMRMNGNTVDQVKLLNNYPGLELEIVTRDGLCLPFSTQLYGLYNFPNLVNAIKIADHLGIEPEKIISGIKDYKPKNNRSQVVSDKNGNEIILDAYNANPSSMEQAISHFISIRTSQKKVMILGDMLELGMDSLAAHQKIIGLLSAKPEIEVLFVGDEFSNAAELAKSRKESFHSFFKNNQSAKIHFESQVFQNHLVLVKGSRGIALEKIFTDILK